MSWQGNELFVSAPEFTDGECAQQMIENLRALFDIYEAHGEGWYLLGCIEQGSWFCETEDDFEPFNPTSYMGEAPYCWCWLPNPFMHPAVMVLKVRRAGDLLDAAFEGWDGGYDMFAYAGDGDEPLERMEVYGKVYDMRPEAA